MSTAAASGEPATIDAFLSLDLVTLRHFAPGQTIDWSIHAAGGASLATGSIQPRPGFVTSFGRNSGDFAFQLQPGMTISAGDGTTTKTITLAALTIQSIDLATDRVSGTAPAGARVEGTAFDDFGYGEGSATAGADGSYSIDFSPFDVNYRTSAEVSVADADSDTTSAWKLPPLLEVSLSGYFTATGFADDAPVSFTIQGPGGATLASGTGGAGGATFSRPQDFDFALTEGMRITVGDGTTSKSVVVPRLSIDTIDSGSETVSGSGAPGAPIRVNVYVPSPVAVYEVHTATPTVNGAGAWSANFAPVDINPRSSADATVIDGDGDSVSAYKEVTRIEASLSADTILAAGFKPDADVTFTIEDAAGGLIARRVQQADFLGFASFPSDAGVDLKPGMRITATDGAATKSLALPLLSIGPIDLANDVVEGSAPPGSLVQVGVSSRDGSSYTGVTTDGSGRWRFEAPFDVGYDSYVSAQVVDDDGDTTFVIKEPTVIWTWPGNTAVQGRGFEPYANAVLTVRESPGGSVISTTSAPVDARGAVTLFSTVALAGGMEVTLSDGVSTKRLTVPALAINGVLPATDDVVGKAPPGTVVWVTVPSWGQQVTADGSGRWTAHFSGLADITQSSSAHAVVRDEDGDATNADKSPARIEASLTSDVVSASSFTGAAPVTLTVRSAPGGGVVTALTKQADVNGFLFWNRFEIGADLVAGMELTVSDGLSTRRLVLPPLAITTFDPAHDRVAGTAAPGAVVSVSVGGTSRQVTVGAGGGWSAIFTPFDVLSGMSVDARTDDDDGDTTTAMRFPNFRTTIESGPVGLTNDSTPTFTFSADDQVTFECRVDGAAFAPCASPYTTTVLGDGGHQFDVRLVYGTGGRGIVASRMFTVDARAPVTTVDGPAGATNDATPTFTFSADEPAAFECRLDAAAFASCASPYTTAALADGAHVFAVRATDAAGNAGAAATRSFSVDTRAPVVSVDSGPTRPTNVTAPTFTFSADEQAAFQCRLDGAPFAACVSPYASPVLLPGAHVFDVRAVDAAGNAGAATRAFRIQTVPDHVVLRFVSDNGARIVTWEGDVARTSDVAVIPGVTTAWGSVGGSGEFGEPATTFSISLAGSGVGRVLNGSITATRKGGERIEVRNGSTPYSFSNGSAATVSPVRATYSDGRSTVFGSLTVRIDDGAFAAG